MKRFLTIAASALAFTAMAQDVQLTIHPDQGKDIIPNEIYGQFSEHLGSCIYGGLWVGPNSDIPNINGYRKDVFEALKELNVPVMRWPGGCFADDYHWMDGIGPQENRRVLVNNNWGGTEEDNSFGTHEFLNLCEMLGCEPYISINVGSGTVEEMSNWIEYMTADGNSTWAKMRRENGREKPWKVKYIGIGNEAWGCGGNMTPEYYSDQFRKYGTYVRNHSGNQVYKIASGASDWDTRWTDVCMKNIGGNMRGISLHYYSVRNWDYKGKATDFTQQEYYETLSRSTQIEKCLKQQIAVMDKYDPERKIDLLVDEWGTWWEVEEGTNPGHLFQQCTMRDALVASSSLDIFHKYTNRVKMTNIAQVVNVLQAMILTKGKQMLLTPTYHIFKMYNIHREATYLPATLTCDRVVVNEEESVAVVSSSSSRDKNGVIHVSLSNLDMTKEHVVAVNVDGIKVTGATGEIINGKNVDDYNDFGKAEVIAPKAFNGAKVDKKGQLIVTLPAHSVVTLTLKTK